MKKPAQLDAQARSRLVYALLFALVITLGLASRAKPVQPYLPQFINDYAGDTLWALMAFLGIGFLWPKLSTGWVAAFAFGFALLIEGSQLSRAPWLEALRHTRFGGLVLGYGFLWSDLVCYAAGVVIGAGLEWLLRHKKALP